MQYSTFHVEDIKLTKMEFKINKDFCLDSVNVDFDYESKYLLSEDKTKAKVEMKISVFDKENITGPFSIEMVMEGVFTWRDDFSEKDIKSYLEVNANAILFSYARPIITQISTFSGYPPLILPLINFVESQ